MENLLNQLGEAFNEKLKKQFLLRRSVMSFQDYLLELVKHPERHLRNAAHYFSDVIDYFGSYDLNHPTGKVKRYCLFDAAFDQGEGQISGQENVQNQVVRLVKNFFRSGKTDRLILLHGPNGSAKTSLIQALARAAEVYSEAEEGALYRFNWVFPSKKNSKGGIGFSDFTEKETKSYAYIGSQELECTIPCEYKDHPFLLLSAKLREKLIGELLVSGRLTSDFPVPEIFKKGDLSSKNKKILDALLTSYQGDMEEVLKHVQVQRFYLSKRYRSGLVSVEPQMSVDAHVRQLTADQSLASLPVALQHMALFETGGALADGNRGLVEYNDLLKRPLDTWKYLLVATEQGQASLDIMSIYLDVLMVASSNELHLSSFREYPDWQSFKGRFELVKVPYLRRFSEELRIYENQVPKALIGTHIAPHALEAAARWAILTRLEAPRADNYPEPIRDLIRSLSPLEKLALYDTGDVPERLTQKEARELRQVIHKLYSEYESESEYEGRYGASPREIRTLIFNASQNKSFDHLSPFAVLAELRLLVKERSSYEYLRRESVRGYRDPLSFIGVVESQLEKQLDEEVKRAMGLMEGNSHHQTFERYIKNVSAWTKNEKLLDSLTGKMQPADSNLMGQIERILLARGETPEDFRRSLISQIGAFKLENPEEQVDYEYLFKPYLTRIQEDYYGRQQKVIERLESVFLKMLEGDTKGINEKELQQAALMQKNLYQMGYNDSSMQKAIAYLLNQGRC